MAGWGGLFLALLQLLLAAPPHVASSPPPPPPVAADEFQFPLSSWSPHCLGFGSQWRYCNGVPLRTCPAGAVWLHTGTDVVASVGEPVAAATG